MEVEAGINIENLSLLGKASLKMLSFWWPVVVVGIIGTVYSEKKNKGSM